MNLKTAPIFLSFLAMGFGDAAGPFVNLAREQFKLNNFEAQLISFMGFIMFGLLSIAIGVLQDRTGKKKILLMGLIFALAGLGIPVIAGFSSYGIFLVTMLLLGAGAAVLQVAGNPIMRDVSEAGTYSRNLSLAQFIKAMGSLSCSLLPFAAARWFGADWKICFPVFSLVILATICVVSLAPIQERRNPERRAATIGSCLKLLNDGYVLMMVVAIFMYVGAEVCVSTAGPIALTKVFNQAKDQAVLGNTLFFISILAGRLFGSVLLGHMSARKFLVVTSAFSIFGLLGLFMKQLFLFYLAITIAGLGFANIFPLIFSITIENRADRSNEISGLMVTAIVGGAFLPPLMGLIADKSSSVATGFLVPLVALFWIAWTSLRNLKRPVVNPPTGALEAQS